MLKIVPDNNIIKMSTNICRSIQLQHIHLKFESFCRLLNITSFTSEEMKSPTKVKGKNSGWVILQIER